MNTPSETIFVVDDDEAVRESLRALLEAYSFDVEDYSSGIEFLEHFSGATRGCLVLDMHMPVLSGLDVLERLRAQYHSNLPVLLITGRGDKATRSRVVEAGANLFLEKPVDEDVLLGAVRRLLDMPASAAPV